MRLAPASVILLFTALLLPSASAAQTECTRRIVERATPGGEGQPGVVVDCDTPPDAGLLAPDAAATVCVGASDPSLPAGSLEACQQAVASAQQLLRRARIRAALREGVADETFVLDYYEAGDPDPNAALGLGRLASVVQVGSGGLVEDFAYDLRGRLVARAREFGGSGQFAFGTSFDLLGRPTTTVLPDGGSVQNVYRGASSPTSSCTTWRTTRAAGSSACASRACIPRWSRARW